MEDKIVERYRNQFGTQKEQELQLSFLWINKQAGNHPYFNVSNSIKVKNKRRRKKCLIKRKK